MNIKFFCILSLYLLSCNNNKYQALISEEDKLSWDEISINGSAINVM